MSNWVIILEEIENALNSVQINLSGKVDEIATKVSNLNTNPNEPLNVLIIEQSWALNPENTDWGFRQTGFVGAALWHYGNLASDLKDSFYKYADMNAVAASSTAMNAVAASSTAMAAIEKSTIAKNAIYASNMAVGKYVAKLAGLNPTSYADMNAVAASSTAMNAVAASSTAMNAVAASSTALDCLYAKKQRMSGASKSLSGKFIILEISSSNVFKIGSYGEATLSDKSKPDWTNYKTRYAYFKQYKKYSTNMKNDTDSDDWIDYFKIG